MERNSILKNKMPPLKKAKILVEQWLEENPGKTVADLRASDPVYKYIKYSKVANENGERMTVEEIFSAIGYPRERKIAESLEQSLIDQVNEYLRNGGDLNDVKRKSLPFYQSLLDYCRAQRRKGFDLSPEQAMRKLGFGEYSDIYHRFSGLEKLKDYVGEDGFVHLETNTKLKDYLKSAAGTLGMPTSLVVLLICDLELKDIFLNVDYIKQVREDLIKFAKSNNDSLLGLSNKDPELYQRLRGIRRKGFCGFDANALSVQETLDLLGLSDVPHSFSSQTDTKRMSAERISELYELQQQSGGSLRRNQISSPVYHELVLRAGHLGISVQDYLSLFGVNYQTHASTRAPFGKMKVNKFPYIDEMRAMRDQLLQERGVCEEKGFCKEEVFENRVEVCQEVYNQFRDKIFNFDEAKVYGGKN